jgi:hypothetical protein
VARTDAMEAVVAHAVELDAVVSRTWALETVTSSCRVVYSRSL